MRLCYRHRDLWPQADHLRNTVLAMLAPTWGTSMVSHSWWQAAPSVRCGGSWPCLHTGCTWKPQKWLMAGFPAPGLWSDWAGDYLEHQDLHSPIGWFFSAVQASWEAGAGEEMTEGWGCEGQKTKERKERGNCLEAGDCADRRLGRGFWSCFWQCTCLVYSSTM